MKGFDLMGLLDRLFKSREQTMPTNAYPEFGQLVEQSIAELRQKTQAQ